MKRAIPTIIAVIFIFGITSIGVGKIYKIGQNRPPQKYSIIPEETLKRLAKEGLINIIPNDVGPSWNNENDLGAQTDSKWSNEEDNNFLVYYHRDKEAVWQGHAQQVLRAANQNIEVLTELMGKYFYPEDVNNRKLPIYLPTSLSEYVSVCGNLLGRPVADAAYSLGITITTISTAGCKTEGIVLNPSIFEENDARNNYKTVLLHEMHHYVYRTAIDYSQDIEFYNWQIEGLADFCCNRNRDTKIDEEQIQFINNNCHLDKNFPNDNNAPYWAGEQFFYYMEHAYGRDFLKAFIQSTYNQTTPKVFQDYTLDVKEEHERWVFSLQRQI